MVDTVIDYYNPQWQNPALKRHHFFYVKLTGIFA